jgi:transglutaminase-like putative cysteine protease
MQYTIRHTTRFTYEVPISESVMEARMQPRSEGGQRCVRFGLSTLPASRVRMYQDHDGNVVHHFNIPGRHSRLAVTAEALVECLPHTPVPSKTGSWDEVDALTATGAYWELLNPSPFARPTTLLMEFAQGVGVERGADPMTALTRLTSAIYDGFEYSPKSTRVDSPIDEALASRRGVCQDFAHIMIALGRHLGIPCRYVSGYLFHQSDSPIRSSDDATHAWVEARLPEFGWVGFDPTNKILSGDRHIAVATGRDYTDVPPTRGVFKGTSAVRSELSVSVRVGAAQQGPPRDVRAFNSWMSREADAPPAEPDAMQQMQQQQQ